MERLDFLSDSHHSLFPHIALATSLPPPKSQSITYIQVDIERTNGRAIHMVPECHLAVGMSLVKNTKKIQTNTIKHWAGNEAFRLEEFSHWFKNRLSTTKRRKILAQ